jgi:hypothetical protein
MAKSCDVAIVVVVVVVRRERRIEEKKKMDSLLSVNIYSAFFFLSDGNITINRNDMQIVFVVVRRRGKYD